MNYIQALKQVLADLKPDQNPEEGAVFSDFAVNIREDISDNKIINYLPQSRLSKVIELGLFMLSGIDSAKPLQALGNTELDHCAVTHEDLVDYIKYMEELGFCTPEQALVILGSIADAEGSLGFHYGHLWRFWPRVNQPHLLEKKFFNSEHIPQQYKDRAEEIFNSIESLEERLKIGSAEELAYSVFFSMIDQIALAIAKIKEGNASEPIVIMGYNPACAPFYPLGKKAQPMLMRTSVTPNPALMQIYVADEEDGRKLYFHIHLLQVDLYEKMPVFLAMFSAIAHLIARESNSEATILNFLCGEAYIQEIHYQRVLDRVIEFNNETPCMKLLYVNKKSLYDITMEDLAIVECSNPEIKENV